MVVIQQPQPGFEEHQYSITYFLLLTLESKIRIDDELQTLKVLPVYTSNKDSGFG